MNLKGYATVTLATSLVLGGLAVGGRFWSAQHVQRWTGRQDLGFVSCNHCHWQRIEDTPWAQPRPRHASPAGLAVSPDSTKIYIALDDLDELVEADCLTQEILRRLPVSGRPFGLALDSQGERLYVTCKDSDEVVAVDVREWKLVERVGVGEGPLAISFCRTKAGDRLVTANSIADNISVLAASPLEEIARPQAGREPYAVAISPDGSVAFVANRLAVPENHLAIAEIGRASCRERL